MINLLALKTYFTIFSLNVSVIDVIAFVVVFIFALIGAIKGLSRQILSYLGLVLSIVLAFLFCKNVAGLVIDVFPSAKTNLTSKIMGIFGTNLDVGASELPLALENSNIPKFLHSFLISLVEEGVTENVINSICSTLATWLITAISFIGIIVLSLILFALIKRLFKGLTSVSSIGRVDRFLGMIFGFLKGTILLAIVIVLLSLIPSVSINSYLAPVSSEGKQIFCVFNKIIELLLRIPFVSNLF